MQPIKMSEFAAELSADDIKALAQLIVYRVPSRLRVIAAVKYLTRLIYRQSRDLYKAGNPDACVIDTTMLLLRNMQLAPKPTRPSWWKVRRVTRWALLKALEIV
jgi:hypothetical protein